MQFVWQLCGLYFTYHITLQTEAEEKEEEGENTWSKSSDSLDPHESFQGISTMKIKYIL